MDKEICNKRQNLQKISEEIELILSLVKELKEETLKQDSDILSISEIINQTKIKAELSKDNIASSEEYLTRINLLKGTIFSLGITGIIYYTNPYLLLGGLLGTGVYISFKI